MTDNVHSLAPHLVKRLAKSNIDEAQVREEWSTSDVNEYTRMQRIYASKVFTPLLQDVLGRELRDHEAGESYRDTGSKSFSQLYLFYQTHPHLSPHNPVYVAGKLFFIEAYARILGLEEKLDVMQPEIMSQLEGRAAISLLECGAFAKYDTLFWEAYKITPAKPTEIENLQKAI